MSSFGGSIFNDGLPMLHRMTLDTVMDPILETSGLDQAMPEIKAGNIRNERTQRTQRRRQAEVQATRLYCGRRNRKHCKKE